MRWRLAVPSEGKRLAGSGPGGWCARCPTGTYNPVAQHAERASSTGHQRTPPEVLRNPHPGECPNPAICWEAADRKGRGAASRKENYRLVQTLDYYRDRNPGHGECPGFLIHAILCSRRKAPALTCALWQVLGLARCGRVVPG
jgi:hypothetical protein